MLQNDQVDIIQKDVWRRCAERKLGGFFVRSGEYLVGLFEGKDSVVIGQVEHLIRKHGVSPIYVVREAFVDHCNWVNWNKDVFDLAELTDEGRKKFEGLAQIVEIAVEADLRSSLDQ